MLQILTTGKMCVRFFIVLALLLNIIQVNGYVATIELELLGFRVLDRNTIAEGMKCDDDHVNGAWNLCDFVFYVRNCSRISASYECSTRIERFYAPENTDNVVFDYPRPATGVTVEGTPKEVVFNITVFDQDDGRSADDFIGNYLLRVTPDLIFRQDSRLVGMTEQYITIPRHSEMKLRWRAYCGDSECRNFNPAPQGFFPPGAQGAGTNDNRYTSVASFTNQLNLRGEDFSQQQFRNTFNPNVNQGFNGIPPLPVNQFSSIQPQQFQPAFNQFQQQFGQIPPLPNQQFPLQTQNLPIVQTRPFRSSDNEKEDILQSNQEGLVPASAVQADSYNPNSAAAHTPPVQPVQPFPQTVQPYAQTVQPIGQIVQQYAQTVQPSGQIIQQYGQTSVQPSGQFVQQYGQTSVQPSGPTEPRFVPIYWRNSSSTIAPRPPGTPGLLGYASSPSYPSEVQNRGIETGNIQQGAYNQVEKSPQGPQPVPSWSDNKVSVEKEKAGKGSKEAVDSTIGISTKWSELVPERINAIYRSKSAKYED